MESILYKRNTITFKKEIVKDNFCQVHFIQNKMSLPWLEYNQNVH
jgi:hypothetical protein